jgi:hypothetical protein
VNNSQEKEIHMFEICITIAGQKHCFPVPTLIDQNVIRRPPPNNYPPFELAVSVLMLVQAVPASELTKQLTQVATSFIQQVQKDLPKGVEIVPAKAHQHSA